MKIKTIWILNHYAITPEQGGGTRHFNFAKELINRGYTVYVFASAYVHNSNIFAIDDNVLYKEKNIDGINWIWINTRRYSKNGINRVLGMIDYYKFIVKNYSKFEIPDLIIGSSVHPFACLAGIKIAQKIKCRYFSEIRDLWPQTLVDMGKLSHKSITARFLYSFEKYIYKNSEKIIVTVPGMIDYIVNLGIPKQRMVYINNGVDVINFDYLRDITNERVKNILLENNDKFKIIYSGAMGEANGLINVIKAAQMIEEKKIEIVFIFVGGGSEKSKLQQICELQNINNVKFYESLPKTAIPNFLCGCDLMLFNLLRVEVLKYGLSANKLFDYMCSCKPVVFACETPTDYIRECKGGISIEPENYKELTMAVEAIYNMTKEERQILGHNARKYVESNFDIPILVDKLVGAIEDNSMD